MAHDPVQPAFTAVRGVADHLPGVRGAQLVHRGGVAADEGVQPLIVKKGRELFSVLDAQWLQPQAARGKNRRSGPAVESRHRGNVVRQRRTSAEVDIDAQWLISAGERARRQIEVVLR